MDESRVKETPETQRPRRVQHADPRPQSEEHARAVGITAAPRPWEGWRQAEQGCPTAAGLPGRLALSGVF